MIDEIDPRHDALHRVSSTHGDGHRARPKRLIRPQKFPLGHLRKHVQRPTGGVIRLRQRAHGGSNIFLKHFRRARALRLRPRERRRPLQLSLQLLLAKTQRRVMLLGNASTYSSTRSPPLVVVQSSACTSSPFASNAPRLASSTCVSQRRIPRARPRVHRRRVRNRHERPTDAARGAPRRRLARLSKRLSPPVSRRRRAGSQLETSRPRVHTTRLARLARSPSESLAHASRSGSRIDPCVSVASRAPRRPTGRDRER